MTLDLLHYFLAESPDEVQNNHWTNDDARAFFISPNLSVVANSSRLAHDQILAAVNNLCEYKSRINFPQLVSPIKQPGIYIQGDMSPLINQTDRSEILKLSSKNNMNIMVGRIWINHKMISFWNDISDCSINAIACVSNNLETVFTNYNLDTSIFGWEIFDRKMNKLQNTKIYTLDELEDRLNNPAKSEPTDHINDDDHSILHTLMPGRAKEQAMLDRGMKKSPAIDIRNRPTRSGD